MGIRWKRLLAVPALCSAMSCQAVEVEWSSACDFAKASLALKDTASANPDTVMLNVTLNDEAAARLEKVTRANLHQEMSLIVDGKLISTTRINGILNTNLQIALSKQVAREMVATILTTSKGACGSNHHR